MLKLLHFIRNIIKFIPYFYRFKWSYMGTFIFLGTSNLCQLFIPRVIKRAVDSITEGILPSEEIRTILFYSALYILLFGLGIYISRVVWRFFLWITGIRINVEIRDRFFGHLLKMGPSFYDKNKTGELMALATNDINAVTMVFRAGVVSLFDGTFLLVLSIIFMMAINMGLTLLVFLPFPIIMLFTLQFNYKIHRLFRHVQETFADMTEFIREYVWGIRVIRAHSKDKINKRMFDEVNNKVIRSNLDLVKFQGIYMPAIFVFSQISYIMLIFFGGRRVILQDVSMGDFVAFVSYLLILTWPTIALGWSVNIFERGAASMKRLDEIFAIEPQADEGNKEFSKDRPPHIRINDLVFNYPDSNNGAFIDRLEALPGQYIGIIGKTGSGKSTLLKLIMKVYLSDGIYIENIPLRDIKTRFLRECITVVPQDPVLFSATIRDNITFGDPGIPLEEIERVIDLCSFRKDIESFPDGLDTVVGERGITLSGGQKQRITLARAVILKRPVLLLDDCLSAVDSETEKHILSSLKDYRANITVIAVSNRISSVMEADRIYVFKNGSIEASGKHNELIKLSETYYDIFEKQKLLSEIEELERCDE